MSQRTTVSLSPETKADLNRLVSPEVSFDTAIASLLKFHQEIVDNSIVVSINVKEFRMLSEAAQKEVMMVTESKQ